MVLGEFSSGLLQAELCNLTASWKDLHRDSNKNQLQAPDQRISSDWTHQGGVTERWAQVELVSTSA